MRRFFPLYLLILAIFAPHVAAHPHSFIEMQMSLETKQNKYSGISYVWKMDPMTSADIAYELKGVKPDDPRWKQQEAIIMANILMQNYFTDFYYQDKKVNFKRIPDSYHLEKEGFSLVFFFTASFMQPLPIADSHIKIQTYDPSFYVSMTYQNKQQITLPIELAANCDIDLQEANITDSMRAYAFSLDKSDTPEEDLALGKQFAQRVDIRCP
ncbi:MULTISPECIES: DUF1007 family protein [Providencia]|uniref:DUF1007 family protein n=5 Tax=Gammaproteobacteria TaxID=1236 RepID=A0AA42FLX9_9GAMM|nr:MULTISPECIES: DUF1007 family protein [Providencia]HCI95613.1 DUF1007 domain-containing protein [Providencia sp.]APC11114.1 hypothetical protein RB151_014300 [Providencia rettgeri]AVL74723.1 DUF1007 domain-containing protein [Providencia rettgeri]EIL1981752.1 DUF1007 family protein [Providencia rettgeri]EIU7558110.1 DUF1007 family protein [Providencia rettgeri]